MHESVSGSRKIKRNSKKGSKKGSKKSSRMDFSGLLDDMENEPMMQQQNQGHQMQMPGMQQMPQMQMPEMQMPGMQQMPGMMPGMGGMDPLAMAQMAMPQMGMPQMMMGATPENVDPLHLQHFVPQNQNSQINNFGVNPNQLMSGAQMSQQFRGREMAPQVGGGNMFSAYDSFINKFM
jgi:hypothetical protein